MESKRLEYYTYRISSANDEYEVCAAINQLCKEGWEVVNTYSTVYTLEGDSTYRHFAWLRKFNDRNTK